MKRYLNRKTPFERKTRNRWLEKVLPQLLSIFTLLVGAFLGAWFTQNNWQKQHLIEYRDKQTDVILNKRIDLIDKTSKLVADSYLLKVQYEGLLKLSGIQVEKSLKGLPTDNIDNKTKDAFEKVFAYRRDLYSTLQLDALYFGPQTFEVIKNINSNSSMWLSEEQGNNLVKAIVTELTYQLSTK